MFKQRYRHFVEVLIGKKEQYKAFIITEYRRTDPVNEKTPGGKEKRCNVRVAAAALMGVVLLLLLLVVVVVVSSLMEVGVYLRNIPFTRA